MPPARPGPIIRKPAKAKAKPKPNPAVFGPIGRADKPLTQARQRATRKVQRATRKVQAKTVVPYVPKLKHPTPAQRGAAQSLVARSLHKQGITTTAQVRALPREQRRRVNRATGYAQTNFRRYGGHGTAVILPGRGHRKISALGLNVDLTKIAHSGLVKNVARSQIPAFVKGMTTIAKPVGEDAAQLAVSTPSSVAHLASTAVHHPTKVPSELAAPYKELINHPKEFISKHPLSTVLMVAPAVKGPGLTAGKVARVAGKQTLEREAARLPGTALKESPKASRDVVVNALQKRKDRKAGNREMTVRQVQKRVDEAVGAGQKRRDRIEAAIARKTKEQAKALPKGQQRDDFVAEQKTMARGASKEAVKREIGREFGATAYRDAESGAIVKPKNAAAGHLHDNRADAQAVADALNRKPKTLQMGGHTAIERGFRKVAPGQTNAHELKFVVRQAGNKYSVLPDIVDKRLEQHRGVGTSKAGGSKLLRQSRGMFTRAVLPTRPTWLSGQGIEGSVRAAVQGAGPTSYLRAAKLRKSDPELFKQLADRAVPAGKIGKVMKEFAGERKTFAEDWPGNPVAESLTALGKTPGVKQVRHLYATVTDAVFKHLNGHFLEAFPQTVMLGRALKKSPLMDHHIIGLSDRAIQEAANGLRETHAQNALAREVQRGYGKYSNFSPGMREMILHWTPFIPWTLNAIRFLTTVLPKDHPVVAALIADADQAEQDWLKAHRLQPTGSNHLPFFDLGGYPTNGGKSVLRIGHYTPFGVAPDPTGGLADIVLPQFSGFYGAVKYGVDWKGQELKHGGPHGKPFTGPEKWLYGAQQLAEAMIPLTQQAQDIAHNPSTGQLRHELRLLSSTRVKPKNQDKSSGGDGWGGSHKSSGSDGWGGGSSSSTPSGDGWGD